MPWDIEDKMQKLKRDFKAKDAVYFGRLRAFCRNNPKDADEIFEHLLSPSAEAHFDIERYEAKYFPEAETEDQLQRPRDKKTHWSIALPCYRAQEGFVKRRAERRGLTFKAVCRGFEQTFVMGWAVGPVLGLANKYTDHDYNRRFRDREAELKELYNQHVAYCQMQPAHISGGPANDLLRLVGHYVLRCDRIVPAFDISSIATLDINNMPHSPPMIRRVRKDTNASRIVPVPMQQRPLEDRGILAAFDLGVLRGTMAIVTDPFILEAFRLRQKAFDEYPTPRPHQRMYFEWRGHSARGVPQGQEDLPHIGFMDFDEDFTMFKGIFQTEHFGSELVISGYKIANIPRVVPEPWDTLDPNPDDKGSEDMERSSEDNEQHLQDGQDGQGGRDGQGGQGDAEAMDVEAHGGNVEREDDYGAMDVDTHGKSGEPVDVQKIIDDNDVWWESDLN
jgi:hypothetical protein